MFDPCYHQRLAAGLDPIGEREIGLYWEASLNKVLHHASRERIPDHGGCALLCALGDSWRIPALKAIESGEWAFSPLIPNFEYKSRLQTASSLLDRTIVQLTLGEVGFHMQAERINSLCDDELMPIPPACRFRPPLAQQMYSDWRSDFALWRDAERLFSLRGYEYVVKTDVRNCFYNIPRRVVLALLSRDLQDPVRLALIERRLAGPVSFQGSEVGLLFGLPVSEPCSHLLANLYLAEFDRWAIQTLRVPHVRYIDDMRFFCHSKAEGAMVLERVREELAVRFGLMLNDEKSAVEALSGPPASREVADKLLRCMKEAIHEPLELRRIKFRAVPWSEIIDNWKKLQGAIAGGGLSGGDCEESLNCLASLRPCPTCESEEDYFAIMSTVLSMACGTGVEPSPVRTRAVAIAMGHLVKADAERALTVLEPYLQHSDPLISRRAYQWIVWSRVDRAQPIAEQSIIDLVSEGRGTEAADRLVIYRMVFGLTQRLRELFRTSSVEALRVLATAPGGHAETPHGQLVEELSDGAARVRRNAALRILGSGMDTDQLRDACRKALAKETDRDARLSLLLAFHSFRKNTDASVWPDCCFPTSALEKAAIDGLASGLVCVDAIGNLTYAVHHRFATAVPDGAMLDAESGPDDGAGQAEYRS